VPRLKKGISYTSDAEVIRRYFREAMALKRSQKNKNSEITALNVSMTTDGVDPGILSLFCKIANMPPAKRALHLTLSDLYRHALAGELEDPSGSEDRSVTVPFGAAQAA
jgi:hypothetical protein